MIFKNLSIFRTATGLSQKSLDDYLTRFRFEPCLPTEETSAGFTPVFGLDNRVYSANGCHLFCLKVDQKVIPPSAVNAEFKNLRDIRQEALGRKLNAAERDELRAEARASLCERAFCRPADLWAYWDARAGLLVINTTSAKTADGLAQTLKGCVPDSPIVPLEPGVEIRGLMTEWLKADSAPAPFMLGHKCEISDGEGVIRYKDRILSDSKLQEYLQEGLLAETLSLKIAGEVGFVLTTDFVIKEFAFDDERLKSMALPGADPLEKVSIELVEMSNQVRSLIEQFKVIFDI